MSSARNRETPPTSPSPTPTDELIPSARRSSRVRKEVKKYEDEHHVIAASVTPSRASKSSPNRNRPKRKAAVTAEENMVSEEAGPELLAEMSPHERKEYAGWVELESEPVCNISGRLELITLR
jgi:hypothetical protein